MRATTERVPRNSDPALCDYLREINATPLLTRDEECELAQRVQRGDGAARDHLIRANLRLVVSIARKIPLAGLPLADAIADGNLGLLRAAESFDPDRGTRFSTYASYWIKQSIHRAIRMQAPLIRLPNYLVDLMLAEGRLSVRLGREPTAAELSAATGITEKKAATVADAKRVRFDRPTDAEGVEMPPEEWVAAPRDEDDAMERAEAWGQVAELLDRLPAREAAVLRLRYGLDGEPPKTLAAIGARLGITRERVRQIENEALAQLRKRLTPAE